MASIFVRWLHYARLSGRVNCRLIINFVEEIQMTSMRRLAAIACGICLLPVAGLAVAAAQPAAVNAQRLVGAENEPDNWMTTGRTYSEQRFFPAHPGQRQERR
jgi:hypothetical protein